MIKLLRTSAMLTLLGLMVAGCGQKGPLYLPGDEEAAERYGPREEAQQDEDQQDDEQQESADESAPDTTSEDES
ncbi:LPS translocon maturation chaperone LptM [Halomonas cupida]|uniref:LPS translocon maturation chaperone LptM n=1 Tax=Halomonas cupida TaxID=44933 RepID=UPI003A8FB4C5